LERRTQHPKKQGNNNEQQFKETLIAPTLRENSVFDAAYQSKLEDIEQDLVTLVDAYVFLAKQT
jgi:hypothetical protein